MSEMQVQRYSTEVKVYITATVVLAALIVGLVWWNSTKDKERQIELQNLYSAYQDLGQHIKDNINVESIAVCQKLPKPTLTDEEKANAEPDELKAREEAYSLKLADHQTKVQNLTNHLSKQYSFLNQKRPVNTNPELMTDAVLFRLNKTYSEVAKSMEKLAERCGDLTPEQVAMRQRRFNKAVARFTENLKDLEAPARN